MHIYVIASVLAVILTCIVAASVVTSVLRASRRNKLVGCIKLPTLHVVAVCDVGDHEVVGAMVAHLLDSATCPTQINVSILESVPSIKAPDRLESAIKIASELGPRYGKHFKENIQLHRVHQSRGLTGASAVTHLLESLKGTLHGWVIYMPPRTWTATGWDVSVRRDIADADAFCKHGVLEYNMTCREFIVTWPLAASPQVTLETWVYPPPLQPQFFTIAEDLTFSTLPMARPATVLSLGVSMRHPFAVRSQIAQNVFKESEDLALTYLALQHALVVHGASSLGTITHGRVSSYALQERALKSILSEYPAFKKDFFARTALDETDGIYACGRAAMGMVTTLLPEILIKWGSPGAYETEKESQQYG